jgi:formylglycine-generating enzyme required for sulfatase activity
MSRVLLVGAAALSMACGRVINEEPIPGARDSSIDASGSGIEGGTAIPDTSTSPCADGACAGTTIAAESCQPGGPGLTDCGPSSESCCTSLEVSGGTYFRTYDPFAENDASLFSPVLAADGGPSGVADPATVSSFLLDKYLVTVGRFRQFVMAWNGGAGYTPPPGTGKHRHLNGGNGLNATTGGYEPGWAATDDSNIAPTDMNLACGGSTWTPSPGSQENLPITCVNWYEAYAFCIWDGGFLPSEAEWEYAAAGGSQQRLYPWGPTDPGTSSQYAIQNTYNTTYPPNIAPVGTATLGAGLWGQLDLVGEVSEWNADAFGDYVDPCEDCVNVADTDTDAGALWRVLRGLDGMWSDPRMNLPVSSRYALDPTGRYGGIRCARSPASTDNSGESGAGGCTPGVTQCSGISAVQSCDATGQWGTPWPCTAGTCVGGACTGTGCQKAGVGLSGCGVNSESCCTSLNVFAGTYDRTYTNSGTGATGLADPATVSEFRLDKYLVTVGRFREFVSAVSPPDGGAGWLPMPGSGKHAHLNGGSGLNATAGGYEPGWVAADNSNIAPTDANLACDATSSTWTPSAGPQDALPINCVNWYEAYAFCIWNGGFLPSEAEWEYAAAGGSRQMEYPWGSFDPGANNGYAIYGCDYSTGSGTCTGVANIAPVGMATSGGGVFGQLDLAGEVDEWNLDWYAPYVDPCSDCVDTTEAVARVFRGGDFADTSGVILPRNRASRAPSTRAATIGFRCARTP